MLINHHVADMSGIAIYLFTNEYVVTITIFLPNLVIMLVCRRHVFVDGYKILYCEQSLQIDPMYGSSIKLANF
jgi:hypothetical protein